MPENIENPKVARRLAAILAADIAGYSALMGADEARTVRDLKAHQAVVLPMIGQFGGRIIDTAGDGILAEFGSVVNAVESAVAIQETMATRNADVEEHRRMQYRIGINLGDVIYDDTRIYGDGINIAARLEGISEPGGICISSKVYDDVRSKIKLAYEDIGEQQLKNISAPVRAYRVRLRAEATTSPPLALPDRPSIAVLPFSNMSGDPEQEYFVDGIVEDILTGLSRIRWLFVIARNSSFTYKGRAVDVKRVGRELGVRYILEGSIRKAGKRVRVTGQLIDAVTGAHIWADRIDGDLDDVFALQDRITESVVAAIEPNLRSVEIKRAYSKPTENLDAYDLYLRALPEFEAFTEQGFRRCEALLRSALKLDPNYSEALAALADCIGRLTVGGWIADWREGGAQTRDIALQAVRADPENGIALSIAAWAIGSFTGPLEQGVHFAHQALRAHPNSALVRTNCGWVFVNNGESDLALEHLHVARRISPLDRRGYITLNAIAGAHFYERRFDETVQWTRRALQQNPTHPISLRFLSAALAHLGRNEEAQDVMRELMRLQPNISLARLSASYRYSWMKDMLIEGLKAAGLPQ